MSSEQSTRDLEALTQVLSALKGLDSTSQKRILEAVTTFLGFPTRVSHPQTAAAPMSEEVGREQSGTFSENRTQTPKEFLAEKQPRTDVHRAVCLGYYLTHYRDTPHFKTIDISKLNTEAAQPKFSNPAKSVDNAARFGYFVPAVKGAKQISAVGERMVQALPDAAAARQAVASSRPRRKPVKKVGKSASEGGADRAKQDE